MVAGPFGPTGPTVTTYDGVTAAAVAASVSMACAVVSEAKTAVSRGDDGGGPAASTGAATAGAAFVTAVSVVAGWDTRR